MPTGCFDVVHIWEKWVLKAGDQDSYSAKEVLDLQNVHVLQFVFFCSPEQKDLSFSLSLSFFFFKQFLSLRTHKAI